MGWEVRHGEALERLAEMPDSSVDAVVTDPPYFLSFMGQSWDSATAQLAQERHEAWAREALRVLKPGGHLLAFGGTRTYHRLACAIEDAGFEVRDCLMWLYGSGFPKSLNVSKALDKAAGAEREVVSEGAPVKRMIPGADQNRTGSWIKDNGRVFVPTETLPATPEAERWEGWGTALKPGWEPIVVARKPLAGTVASNVLEHGTGALNIDGCRTATGDDLNGGAYSENREPSESEWVKHGGTIHSYAGREFEPPAGRWPANVVLSHTEDCVLVGEREVRADGHFPAARGPSGYGSAVAESSGGGLKGQEALAERSFDGELVEVWACVPGCPVRLLDAQTGQLASGRLEPHHERRAPRMGQNTYGADPGDGASAGRSFGGDAGGASRFFYCAKASRAERNAGLDGFAQGRSVDADWVSESRKDAPGGGRPSPQENVHSTVKPIDLMRWLVRLVTPPAGLVVDPFVGSGTTGCAAVLEGFEFVGVERDAGYVEIARARVAFWAEHPTGLPEELALRAEGERRRVREAGQLGLEF